MKFIELRESLKKRGVPIVTKNNRLKATVMRFNYGACTNGDLEIEITGQWDSFPAKSQRLYLRSLAQRVRSLRNSGYIDVSR